MLITWTSWLWCKNVIKMPIFETKRGNIVIFIESDSDGVHVVEARHHMTRRNQVGDIRHKPEMRLTHLL